MNTDHATHLKPEQKKKLADELFQTWNDTEEDWLERKATDCKIAINAILWTWLPGSTTLDEAETIASATFEAVCEAWSKHDGERRKAKKEA